MTPHSRWTPRLLRTALLVAAPALWLTVLPIAGARAQDTTGSVTGAVNDQQGVPLANVQVFVEGTTLGTITNAAGTYTIVRIPAGTRTVRARLIGYRAQAASVTITAGQRATQNFTLQRDPLQLQSVVVTGTTTPRTNLETSNATTTMSLQEITQAAPRSTTEMLRYVPGFTRVESSGGEVNQNISMRGVLGVEYVMFMEDGLPVFPTMHTFFMNADNLFRPDENIERMEVVRGGGSALFGSNTPGAIINFINKTGGDQLSGTVKASAATEGLARYDFNVNGPLAEQWRFNVGGFYRYDRGIRDPGFPGIRGGQVKANVTRLLDNGYVRASVKYIDDKNQFILDLPFQNPGDPTYVPGFGDYGAMNTVEGDRLRIPTPDGDLTLPLSNGIATRATWGTIDASFQFANGWMLQNGAQAMQNSQQWNAIVPSDVMPAEDFVTRPVSQGGLGLPAGTQFAYVYTNVLDPAGNRVAYNTANGLVAPGGEWHVAKPISAFQDQLTLSKAFGPHNFSAGLYFANYSQTNQWYFTDILTDVRNNPHFLDLVIIDGTDTTSVTKNGFRHYVSNYVNGQGQATIVSGVVGGSIQLTDKLRSDLGVRVEYNNFVQSSENTANVDLDGDPATAFDLETWGTGTFRHFKRSLTDWAASVGLNYALSNRTALYLQAARAYKMPALDEFLNAQAQAQVSLFDSREVRNIEGGVKYATPNFGLTVNGFFTDLRNIVGQGAVVDTLTGRTTWIITTSPENRSYGAEIEASGTPVVGLDLLGSVTILKAELGSGAGADIGSWINGVPPVIGNASASYTVSRVRFTGDWHYVGRRYSDFASKTKLPQYSYFNFGAGYTLPGPQLRVNLDVLNAFQSKGLEEGNPRLTQVGGRTSDLFLARPILPRRFMLSLQHDF